MLYILEGNELREGRDDEYPHSTNEELHGLIIKAKITNNQNRTIKIKQEVNNNETT